MLKNIVLPLIALVFVSIAIVYFSCYYNSATKFIFVTAFFISYGLCGNTAFNYIFCRIFPDPNNNTSPPAILFIRNGFKITDEMAEVKETRAFSYTTGSTLLLVFAGVITLYLLSQQYEDLQFKQYGKITKGVLYKGHSRKRSAYRYEFKDMYGNNHTNSYDREASGPDIKYKEPGDTVSILYSAKRPEFNKIIINQ